MSITFRLELGVDASDLKIIAETSGVFAGLASVEYLPGSYLARVAAVVVDPSLRRRGIGTALLSACEQMVAAAGARQIEAWYDAQTGDVEVVHGLFRKARWEAPLPGMLMVQATRRVLEAPWAKVKATAGDEVFAWSTASAQELEALRGETWFPPALGPFLNEPYEPINSLGLRREGRVIGWMLTHRMGPMTVRYSRLFVHPDHRIHARGIHLIVEAVRRQDQAGLPFGTFGVRSDNLSMRRFVERRMTPWVESIKEGIYVVKRLTNEHRP